MLLFVGDYHLYLLFFQQLKFYCSFIKFYCSFIKYCTLCSENSRWSFTQYNRFKTTVPKTLPKPTHIAIEPRLCVQVPPIVGLFPTQQLTSSIWSCNEDLALAGDRQGHWLCLFPPWLHRNSGATGSANRVGLSPAIVAPFCMCKWNSVCVYVCAWQIIHKV